MPTTTKSIEQITNLPCCPYKGKGPALDHYPHCPSDLAIRCANDIIEKISQLGSVEVQEEKFSGIIARSLNKLFGNKLMDCQRVVCFWSLAGKAKPEEIESGIKKAQDATHKTDNWLFECINNAMSRVNDRLHSLGFLSTLMEKGIGESHVFDIKPDKKGFVFQAYSKMSLTEGNGAFKHHLHFPNETTFRKLLDDIEKRISKKNIADAEEIAFQIINEFCLSWSGESKQLLNELKNKFLLDNNSINENEITTACAHFALISLFSVHNKFCHASYILAIAFRRDHHSSMVLFWPFDFQNSPNQHILFLLHLILGLNSIETKKTKRELEYSTEVSGILAHDMRSFQNNIFSIRKMVEKGWQKGKISEAEARSYFDTMVSSALLFSQGIGIGLSVALSHNH